MNLFFFLGIMVVMLWIAGVFLGTVKGMSKGFQAAPTIDASSSREVREKFEDDVDELKEKNARMMDDLKSKMERHGY